MSNNNNIDFGNAEIAVKPSSHPEIIRRNEEIEAMELTVEETRYCLWAGKSHKWHQERNAGYWNEK